MNQETIERHIKSLGKLDFDNVMSLILDKIYQLRATDVDGKGDGGTDYRLYNDSAERIVVGIQKTIQEKKWQEKCYNDAKKVKSSMDAKRFFYFTTVSRAGSEYSLLEEKILNDLDMHAKCLGAKEIAGMIVDRNLIADFARAIKLDLIAKNISIDPREVLLHHYFVLSEDSSNFQNEIIENAILSRLSINDGIYSRDELVEDAMTFLNLPEMRRIKLVSRIDALFSAGKIFKQNDKICLNVDKKNEIEFANGMYYKELNDISNEISNIISSHGVKWSHDDMSKAALLLSRAFVEEQLKNAKHSSLSLAMTGFGDVCGKDAKSELSELILQSGISGSNVHKVMQEIVDVGQKSPLISKLTGAVVYASMEEVGRSRAAIILGASVWSDVKVILDASVAIPYLCSQLFGSSSGRFSQGSSEVVNILKESGARLVIPRHYINECASHLVSAVDYCSVDGGFEDDMKYSKNGYVSHYYNLKKMGKKVPDSLLQFIRAISKNVTVSPSDKANMVRSVMQDIQPLLLAYGVAYEHIDRIPETYTRDVEVKFAYEMNKLQRKKLGNLIAHDVEVLSHVKRLYSERGENVMCLTWDLVMISVGMENNKEGWIVSPTEASDLIQSRMKMSDGKLLSLAHSIAKTMEAPGVLGGRIIDRVIQLSGARMADWEFRQKVSEYKEAAIARMDRNPAKFDIDQFDEETDKFLRDQGVVITNDSNEEAD